MARGLTAAILSEKLAQALAPSTEADSDDEGGSLATASVAGDEPLQAAPKEAEAEGGHVAGDARGQQPPSRGTHTRNVDSDGAADAADDVRPAEEEGLMLFEGGGVGGGGSGSVYALAKPILSVSCRLVRQLALQRGRLMLYPDCLRFEPEPEPATEEPAEALWLRDGEPEQIEPPRSRVWLLSQLHEVLPRRYLLRRVALELFSVGGRSHFVCFDDRETRRRMHARIITARPPRLQGASTNVRFGQDALETKHQELIDDWQNWRISNFDYLMRLNTLAGRSYNDITQYPVMPWVIKDYTSASLDLDDPQRTFRDLSKPVGALEPKRADRFRERFRTFDDCGTGEKPFHYGSHYSSAGIVLYYLIRTEPYTTENIKLQGGRFDVADRLFDSVADTWSSCLESMSDVKELIPEFFHCPHFLTNANAFALGQTQTGHTLGDVRLPPWAKDADDFVRQNREALESEWVSAQLHGWIDLIFGYKQKGRPAVEALNVFHYLTYEGAVDLERLEPALREAVEAQILFFGQTPAQLLSRPHPKRKPRASMGPSLQMFSRPKGVKPYGPYRLGLRGHPSHPVLDPVVFVAVQPNEDRLITVLRSGELHLHRWFPLKPNRTGAPFTFEEAATAVSTLPEASASASAGGGDGGGCSPCYAVTVDGRWLLSGGHWDCTLRCTCIGRADEVVRARQHSDVVTCIDVGADGATAVSGSADTTVVVWALYGDGGGGSARERISPRVLHVLGGHLGGVACCTLSTQLDLVLSGAARPSEAAAGDRATLSADRGNCMLCCASKGRFVRWLPVSQTPLAVCVSHTGSGMLVYASDEPAAAGVLLLFSVNGAPLARVPLEVRVSRLLCTRDGELVITGEGSAIRVRRLYDLKLLNVYEVPPSRQQQRPGEAKLPLVQTLALSPDNHHAFAATADGGMLIYANPLVDIQVLERLAEELLNL